MKKEIRFLALILALTLVGAALTGCGTTAKATFSQLEDEETIIVTDEDTTEDEGVLVHFEVQDEEEVVQNTQEDSPFVFFEEYIGNFPDEPFDEYELENCDEEVTVDWEVPIDIGGKEVGYIKAGESVHLIKTNEYGSVYRVENNTGYGFEYIYASRNNLLTLDDMKELVLSHINYLSPTLLDTPDSDMEYIEFSVERGLNSGVEDEIISSLNTIELSDYDTFCVICTLSEDVSEYTDRVPCYLVDCKVYYKSTE